jgi:DNA/RNA-binding domain of Phe-tRNA-synthetase-like protein
MMNILNVEKDNKTNCFIGILVMEDALNLPSDKLKPVRQELEDALRSKYILKSRNELKALHPMDAYVSYYKKFGYTYHVLPQLESVIKGKAILSGSPLVEAMFMAELKNMILTAGHDLDKIKLPLDLKVSTGGENFTALSGKNAAAVSGDIMIADRQTVISSILRGPDLRTAITGQTSRVIYTAYAPFGVEEQLVHRHLSDIETYIRIFSQKSTTSLKQIF